MAQWLPGKVVENYAWNDTLFTLRIECEPFAFIAGQFVRLGVNQPDGSRIQRAYSLVNSPGAAQLDVLVTAVADGLLSPQLHRLQAGDTLEISQPPSGFFVLNEVPDGAELWLIGTGTGIGPYFSMLGTAEPWQRFQKIILVHGVRHSSDLCYPTLIADWQHRYGDQFSYVPVVSREVHAGALSGRIPALLRSGELARAAGAAFTSKSQVMLCGNPAMIKDTMALLNESGLQRHLRRQPGQITVEQYWK